jgi:hypothetical protein
MGQWTRILTRVFREVRPESVLRVAKDNWQFSSVVELSVNQHTTEAEESPSLRFVTRKRLVKTLQRNSHCWELLPSNGQWRQTQKT